MTHPLDYIYLGGSGVAFLFLMFIWIREKNDENNKGGFVG